MYHGIIYEKKQVMCVQITVPFLTVHIFIYYT